MAQAAPPQHERDTGGGRPAWLVPTIVAVAVVLVAGVVAIVLSNRGGKEAAAPPTASVVVTTVVAPVPTPSVEPVAREATTSFSAALPDTVLQYALASSAAYQPWVDAGALEAWADDLTDGGSGTVSVLAGQWPTPEEAATFGAGLGLASGPPPADPKELPQAGDVLVDGSIVGQFTITDAGDGTGVAVWLNGTAVFQLTGPVDEIVDLYNAYGL